MVFSADGERAKLVVALQNYELLVINCQDGAIVGTMAIPADAIGTLPRSSTLLALSFDAQWLVYAITATLHVFQLDGLQYYGPLDFCGHQPTAIAFRPGTFELVIACVNNQLQIYNVETRTYTDWTGNTSTTLPLEWLKRKEKVTHIGFSPSNNSTVILQDHAAFFVLHLDQVRLCFWITGLYY